MDIELFVCSATQTSNVSCILGAVVGDSLTTLPSPACLSWLVIQLVLQLLLRPNRDF
jgi:hypothetical protein